MMKRGRNYAMNMHYENIRHRRMEQRRERIDIYASRAVFFLLGIGGGVALSYLIGM